MKHEDVCVVLEFVGNLFIDPVPSDTGAQKNFPKGVCILQGGGGEHCSFGMWFNTEQESGLKQCKALTSGSLLHTIITFYKYFLLYTIIHATHIYYMSYTYIA